MTGSLPSGTPLPAESDPAFERFARLVRASLDVPVALVTFVSDQEQVFPGALGLPEPWQTSRSTPLSHSFCQHVVRSGEPLVVTDARTEPLVAENLAVPDLGVIAYAGAPITDARGRVVGSLCAIDSRPRAWSDRDLAVLADLAGAVSSELRLRAAHERADDATADMTASADQARRLLAQHEFDRSRWALALVAGRAGTFDLELSTGGLTVDDRLLELSGLDRGTFTGRPEDVYARVHPDDLTAVVAAVQRAIDTSGVYDAEYRIVLADGTHRWVAARGQVLPGAEDTGAHLVGLVHDTTAQREPLGLAAQALESMAVGFAALDADWVFTHVNREAERITGSSRADLLGRTIWEVFPATVGTDFEAHYRRAAETGEPMSFDAYYPEPLDVWVEVRAVPNPAGLALHFVDITARARAHQQAEQLATRERLLSLVTEELGSTLDAAEAARRLTRLAVPAVADCAIVTLVDDDEATGSRRGLRTVASWHTDPGLRGLVDGYARTRLAAFDDDAIVERALRTGRLQLIASGATAQAEQMLAPGPQRDALTAVAPEAIAVLPLPGRTGPVGLLTLATSAARGTFTEEELATAGYVAARAGLVLDSGRLYRQQRRLAEGFQRSLLTAPPQPDHLQVVVRYVPAAQAAEVGGDWYDAFMQGDGATTVVIGDVVGHDTQAAAAMGQIRSIVRTVGALDDSTPASVLRRSDEVMQTLQSGILATAVVARLEQTAGEQAQGLTRLRWANAGHPPPMVVAPDGAVTVLTAERADLLLGVDPGAHRQDTQVTLGRDAVVVFYTDGLVERRDQDLDQGTARLQALLAELAGRDLDELCDEVLTRMVPADPDDDVALIAVRLHPQELPRPVEAGPNRVPPDIATD
ncbi:SpoIIE family protein phosphatase [uncultured Modestobacter sp.]|uniref:SpoIIE family protein phosphatase n=1 Tax=uncultured Modestobacter sp. TaxID=380048 RepID=UPI0026135523|nr:SpoIIE family protein phosphatase [uncultured Modestobacter sp.]